MVIVYQGNRHWEEATTEEKDRGRRKIWKSALWILSKIIPKLVAMYAIRPPRLTPEIIISSLGGVLRQKYSPHSLLPVVLYSVGKYVDKIRSRFT